jgi:hypothetical protein
LPTVERIIEGEPKKKPAIVADCGPNLAEREE